KRNAPLVAHGLARKKLTGNKPVVGALPGQTFTGNAFLPARLHMLVILPARLLAKAPATPLFRNVTKVPLLTIALVLVVVGPNAALKTGSATWPAKPKLAKLLTVWFATNTPAAP